MENETITGLSSAVAGLAYRKYCQTKDFMRDTYRWLDHMRWHRFYTFYNWNYRSVRNEPARQHPMLYEYEKLTPEEKRKRDATWELLGQILEELKTYGIL